ncbi:MAG: ribonuclease J [Candidatus Sericytochromatia bacterium]|nr:ribonuclease J [Candidatus Sericytochromatia bacterium]
MDDVSSRAVDTGSVRIIPLGGLGEIGKNMWVVETDQDMVILDCGLGFPSEDMHGIDCVLPNYQYVLERKQKLRGVYITHGHEDHIGGLPYFLQQIQTPVYATPFTCGLIESKLKEVRTLRGLVKLIPLRARETVMAGKLKIEFLRVTHSIADGVAIAVHTPEGVVLYTGDFKLDQTPMDNETFDYFKFSQLGESGVLALMSDSTNANREGFTPSERAVGKSLEIQFSQAEGRIILSTFASNVHRIQQVVNVAHRTGRKVALAGRSMLRVCGEAMKHGYLKDPGGVIVELDSLRGRDAREICIVTTGSQGEPTSGLTRLANGDHRQIRVEEGDTIIYSAVPIPGNERMVTRTINKLLTRGAAVLYESGRSNATLQHVSGHASSEELKIVLTLTKPKFFVPIHGEMRHLMKHAQLATATGVPAKNSFVLENGMVLELRKESGAVVGLVPSEAVLIDGMGLTGINQDLLKQRQLLAQDGALAISLSIDEDGYLLDGPEIAAQGCLFDTEMAALTPATRSHVEKLVVQIREASCAPNAGQMRREISDKVARLINDKTRRRPVVMVIVHTVSYEGETQAPGGAVATGDEVRSAR